MPVSSRWKRKPKRHPWSPETGLENIAETTQKVSDVLDYIKRQTARQGGWQKEVKEYNGKRFGEILKEYIEQDLEKICDTVCGRIGIGRITDEDMHDHQQIYLQLIRQLVRQLVVHYEYEVSKPEQNVGEAGNRAES
jgi:hypothetical protein